MQWRSLFLVWRSRTIQWRSLFLVWRSLMMQWRSIFLVWRYRSGGHGRCNDDLCFSMQVPDDTMTISVLVWRFRIIQWRSLFLVWRYRTMQWRSLFLVWRCRTEPRLRVWPVRPSGPAALTLATGTPTKPNQTEPNQTNPKKTKQNQINHRNLSRPAKYHAKLRRLRIIMSDKTYLATIWPTFQYST